MTEPKRQTAIVAGVGPGLGEALVRKFAAEGCAVGCIARSEDYLSKLESILTEEGATVRAVPADLADAGQIALAFQHLREDLGPPSVLVCHASTSSWQGISRLSAADFEAAWRVTVLGAFLCCQEVVPDMRRKKAGTILFTGATSAIRGRQGAVDFSSAKFALRGMADAMARELWPAGIHVAHIVIDGLIDTPAVRKRFKPEPGEPLLDPTDIAETYWSLTRQPKSAWTFELDLRPHGEVFFE